MSVTAKRFDEKARGEFTRFGTTRVGPGELLRHPVYTRVLHWSVAIFFVLSLLTGFAIYSPWLFRWIAPTAYPEDEEPEFEVGDETGETWETYETWEYSESWEVWEED